MDITKVKILVVDDEQFIRQGLQLQFNMYNEDWSIDLAENGQEAWEKIHPTSEYDIIFCDINMPVMSGIELLQKMQQEKIEIPLVFISTDTMQLKTIRELKLTPYDFIEKPFQFGQLLHIILSLVDHQEKLKQTFADNHSQQQKD